MIFEEKKIRNVTPRFELETLRLAIIRPNHFSKKPFV